MRRFETILLSKLITVYDAWNFFPDHSETCMSFAYLCVWSVAIHLHHGVSGSMPARMIHGLPWSCKLSPSAAAYIDSLIPPNSLVCKRWKDCGYFSPWNCSICSIHSPAESGMRSYIYHAEAYVAHLSCSCTSTKTHAFFIFNRKDTRWPSNGETWQNKQSNEQWFHRSITWTGKVLVQKIG